MATHSEVEPLTWYDCTTHPPPEQSRICRSGTWGTAGTVGSQDHTPDGAINNQQPCGMT